MTKDAATVALRAHGLKATPQRLSLIASIARSSHAPTAAELCQLNPALARSSIYRTLEALEAVHIVESSLIKWQRRYELAAPYAQHHHHFVCESCHTIIVIDSPRIETVLQSIAQQYELSVHSHKLELEGLCDTCARQSTHV